MAAKKKSNNDKKATRLAGGKRLASARKNVKPLELYDLNEAVKTIKNTAKAKFDETIEISINLGIDVRHSDQQVRGVVPLPNGVGKTVRVAVFALDKKAEEAKTAGADLIGGEELIAEIAKGKLDFDRCIATPDMMSKLGKVAKILGPRGLMPNPKLGTVTMDIAKAVDAAKSGQVEFKAEKGGIIHAGLGKASFSNDDLIENIQAFVSAVKSAKPNGAKGVYMKRISLSSTMGPGIKIDISSIAA